MKHFHLISIANLNQPNQLVVHWVAKIARQENGNFRMMRKIVMNKK